MWQGNVYHCGFVRTMHIKTTMCKYSCLHYVLHLRPVLRLKLFILHLLKLLEILFCVAASVSEGLDWQFEVSFVIFFLIIFKNSCYFLQTCQLHDNINSGEGVRRLGYMGDF